MRSSVIDRKLRYLEELFIDLKEINYDISLTGDPSLLLEYEEEKIVVFDEIEDHAQDALFLLEAYIDDCKTENLPIVLEYFRVYKELDIARRYKLLSME